MADSPTHAVFGELRWEAESSWWFTQMQLPSGDWLVQVLGAAGPAGSNRGL